MRKGIVVIGLFFILLTLASSLLAQWKQIPALGGHAIYSLAASRTKIFAGSDSGKIFSSQDSGKTWTLCLYNISNTGNIYALAANGDTVAASLPTETIYISTNNGGNWSNHFVEKQIILSLAFNENELFVGTKSLILRSRNLGIVIPWDTLHTGFATNAFAFNPPNFMAGNLFSIDGEKSWVDVNICRNAVINSLLYRGSDIYAGLASGGICISHDNGNDWEQRRVGYDDPVISLAAADTNIYAATGYGLYLSTDNGAGWTIQNRDSAMNWELKALLVKDGRMYAGNSAGAWVWNFSGKDDSTITPAQMIPFLVSPNPTTGIATIKNISENLSGISILNILGEKVMNIATSNSSEFTIDLTKLPVGMYYAIFALPNSTQVRKIIKQ